MSSAELRTRQQSQQLYLQALTSAYRNSTQLYEPSNWLARDPDIEGKMLVDPDITEAVSYRCALVAGRQWTLQPKSKAGDNADLAVDVGTELLGELGSFTAARKLLARAFYHGRRFARIHGECQELNIGDGKVRTWWLPTRLEDVDGKEMRIVPVVDQQAGTISATYERWNIARGLWEPLLADQSAQMVKHVYQDEQGSLGYGRGLREALAWCWHTKTNVMEEQGRAIERFAGGTAIARVSGLRDGNTHLPNEEMLRRYVTMMTNLRGRHSIAIDKEDEIEILHGSAEGWQMIQDAREAMRTMVKTLVLSANLTTSADKGGSYALGEIQENSTEALVQFDREALEESITKSLIACVWWKNHYNLVELGIEKERPRFNIKQEKRLDPEKRANVAKVAHEMGMPLAKDDVYEQIGFRKPLEGEDVIDGAEPMPMGGMGQQAPGMPGFGGVDPLAFLGLKPKQAAQPGQQQPQEPAEATS